MSDRSAEGLRYRNSDRGILDSRPNIARRRRLGTIAKATAAIVLGLGVLGVIKEVEYATQKHDITPTGIGVGEYVLNNDATLLTLREKNVGQITQVSWDQVTTSNGEPFDKYKTIIMINPPVREVPEPGNPYQTYAILDNVRVDGKETDLAVSYADPNLAHRLSNGFSDVGSFQITPDGSYQATYKGNSIDSSQIGVIVPGDLK